MTTKRYPPCILATCCVPWNDDFSLAEEVFRHEIRHTLADLTRHVYIFGTAGEGYAVSDRQFDEIARVFREETQQPGVHAMVGVISLSLSTMIERIGRARDLGFREFQLSLPSWGALSDAELKLFFQETCGRFPDCSFLHYNLMRTKRLVTPEEYGNLAAAHPNLVATKNSTDSMDRIAGLLSKAPQLQHFPTETGYAYGSLIGECGLLISMSCTNFKAGRRYFEAGQKKDFPRLFAMQAELMALVGELIALGTRDAHMDGAFDKMFCRMHDPRFPLRLLPPYSGMTDRTFEEFIDVVRRKYPHWMPGA